MKRVHPKYLLALAACQLIFNACENEIPFKPKDVNKQLIVSSLMNANNPENKIWLNISGTEKITPVTEGEVRIYLNGQLEETIHPTEPEWERTNGNEYYCRLQFRAGDHIRMEASTNDGVYNAWAETTVPHPIEIEQIDTLTINNNSWNNSLRIKTTFTDNPDEENFYRIQIDKYYTVSGFDRETGKDTTIVIIEHMRINNREDVVLTEGQPGSPDEDFGISQYDNVYNIFNDTRLNGQYTMTTSVEMYLGNIFTSFVEPERISMDVKVRLLSICEAQYYYLRTLNTLDSYDYDEVLSPPVIIYSNVEGGTGIFGISTETSRTINIYKDREF